MSARTRFFAGPIQGRTHRSAPTRSGKISAAHKTILCGSLCHGAGRSPPPTGGAGVDRRRGEVTPPYGSSAGGAQRRADVGIGPYALRGDERAARRGRRALRVVAESRRDCPGQRRTAKRLRQRVRRNGWESRQRSPPKGPSTQDNPSVSLRLTAPFAQGSLWGRGCGLPRRPLRKVYRSPSNRPMWASAPTGGCRELPRPPGQRSERGKSSWSNSIFAR